MSKKRILSVIALALVLVMLTAVVACNGDDTPDTNKPNTTDPVTDNNVPGNNEPNLDDELPAQGEYDLEGALFTIEAPKPWSNSIIYNREGSTGGGLNDAIIDSITAITERFNFEYQVLEETWTDFQADEITTSVLASDYKYDICAVHTQQNCAKLIINDVLTPWNDVPYVNFDKIWWNKNLNETCSVFDEIYFVAGAYNWNSYRFTNVVFFNKDLAEEKGINPDDLYKLVDEGKWTIDKFLEITNGLSTDNGDGIWDDQDVYGVYHDHLVDFYAWYNAFDIPVVTKDNTGKIELTINSPKLQTALEKIYSLCYEDNRTLIVNFNTVETGADNGASYPVHDQFMENKAVFFLARASEGERFLDMESEYGVLPFPKFDESQENYQAYTDAWGHVLCIPNYWNSDEDLKRIGVVTEAFQSYFYKNVVPAYYDVVLQERIGRSPDDKRMLDLIYDNIVYDFGYVYDGNGQGMFTTIQVLLSQQKSTDLQSYAATNLPKAETYYEELYAALEVNYQ